MLFCGDRVPEQEPCLLAGTERRKRSVFLLIFFAKYKFITVFNFSWKFLWSYFEYALY